MRGDVDVEMCRCVYVVMWRYEYVEMWRFEVIDAAKLCLWLVEAVEVLQYKTKKFAVNVIESCLY